MEQIQKIEAKIKKYPGGCWIWQGGWNGREPDFRYKRNRIKVRERLYGWYNGTFPPDKVYRICLNCLCVNPLHMSLEPDKRSVIAKLYDDEDHHVPAIDPDTGEIRRGFVTKKNTCRKTSIKDEVEFFEGNGYGRFIQDGKEARYAKMAERTEENDPEMG